MTAWRDIPVDKVISTQAIHPGIHMEIPHSAPMSNEGPTEEINTAMIPAEAIQISTGLQGLKETHHQRKAHGIGTRLSWTQNAVDTQIILAITSHLKANTNRLRGSHQSKRIHTGRHLDVSFHLKAVWEDQNHLCTSHPPRVNMHLLEVIPAQGTELRNREIVTEDFLV